MADRDEYWYLDDSVDVSRITVPELRSILLKHGVTYPSSAKKPVLVGLFNDRVLPQAAKIHRATARTKPSARGIVDVPSSQESTTTDDAEDETLLAPPPSARRTSRRTARASTEELRAEPAPARRGNSAARHVPTKHARGSDAEVEEQPPVRRTRKSVTPAVKEDSPDPEAWHRHDAESPFTQENPFQSGSSPPAPDSKARDRRRKTMGFEQREKRKSDAYRRKSAMPNVEQLDEGIVVPTRRTFDMPASRIKKEESEFETDGVEAGEEFTPEEQMELVRENAVAGKADILPPRRKKRPSKATGVAKGLTLAVATTLLAAFGGAWSQEKFAVGYCGIGRESTSLGGIEVPDWADFLLPQCEQCPAHATCYPHLDLDCDDDFIKKPHPLSLGGALPLSATCEPDSEKTRRITLVADKSVQILRERRAKYECGEPGADGQLLESPEVKETELKEELSSMKRKGMSQEEFEDLWRSALGEITTREEIVEGSDGTPGGLDRTLSSNSLAELSLICSIQRSLRQTARRYLWQLVLILVVFSSALYGRSSFSANRAMETRAKQLASDAFDRLANHAALNHHEPGAYPELGISMTQLRDDILRTEFSANRRKKLWEKVQKKVEHNSNVRAAVRENQSGDVTRMWEWIGPVGMIEDGRGGGNGSARRESARYSFGPSAIGSSPPVAPDTSRAQIKGVSAWEESRPIY